MKKNVHKLWCMLFMIFSISLALNAQKSPVSVAYIETNGADIRNAGKYTLADGRQVFDIANIFAANINYNTSTRKAYINLNSGVQTNLGRISDLQNKGIKVVLSILGNHQGAGFANFPTQAAAEAFAYEIRDVINRYGLDGVDFDDEFAKYGTNGTGQPNAFSFAFLVRKCRELMPNKLITFYDIGPSSDRLVYGNINVANYLDYVYQPFYGSYRVPGVLPRSQESAAATNYAAQSVNTISDFAQRTIQDGMGVFMTYNLYNGDLSDKVSAFTDILYGSRAYYNASTNSCQAPNPSVASKGTSNINLSWPNAGASYYYIYVRRDGGNWYLAGNNITGTSFNITGLSASTKYYIDVYSRCPSSTPKAPTMTVTTSGSSGGGGSNTNIAIGKGFGVSSTYSSGYEGWRSNDGNRGTRWASAANGTNTNQYVYYDLGAYYNISSVKLYFDPAISRDFNIQIGVNGYWQNATGMTNNTSQSPGLGVNRTARWIRFISWRHAYDLVSLWEFEVYGTYAYAAKKSKGKETVPLDPVDLAVNKEIKVFPNPANSNFNINLKGFEKADITISDLLGKTVYKTSTTSREISLTKGSTFKTGIYIIKVVDEKDKPYTSKLVIK